MLGQRERIQEFQLRFPIFFYLIVGFFALLSYRLLHLQVFKGEYYRGFSEKNSLRREKIPAPRGLVLDRYGNVLVDNRLQLDVTITPQFIKNEKEVIDYLSAISGEPADVLMKLYKKEAAKNAKFQPVTVIENASMSIVGKIESLRGAMGGLNVTQRVRRTYLHKHVGAHLFGYLGEVSKRDLGKTSKVRRGALCAEFDSAYETGDVVGLSGLERHWEVCLRGIDGSKFVAVDAHGRSVVRGDDSEEYSYLQRTVPPVPGYRLVLTVDEDLQLAAAQAMEGKMGAVVALDPRTGEVLSMISQPSFDPTEMNGKPQELWQSIVNNPYGPLRNKAIQDHYSPGSTFKIITALAGLEAGFITPETILNCPPVFKYGNRPFHEHNKTGFGRINVRDAIKKSSDVFFYQVGIGLGIDRIAQTAFDLGLGKLTGVDLADEIPGLMPTEEWKKRTLGQPWFPGETPSAAIGQGYDLVTPIQLATAFAAIANYGNRYKPYVVSRIEDNYGNLIKSFSPQLVAKRPIPEAFEVVLRDAMHAVANEPGGTAFYSAATKDKLLAGKTGTVQVMSMTKDELFSNCESMPFNRRHHAWFAGFAPKDNPEIAIAVFVMHGCGGSKAAAPIAKAVVERWWKKKKEREAKEGPQPASAM